MAKMIKSQARMNSKEKKSTKCDSCKKVIRMEQAYNIEDKKYKHLCATCFHNWYDGELK